MSVLKATLNPINWWNQFPSGLRIVTKMRLLASIGAGGVIYLTPLIFNQIGLSATQIGSGLSISAIAGTIARLISGKLLDRGTSFAWPIRFTALIAIIADIFLINAKGYNSFIKGELLIGLATGFYWPAIELAIPISCRDFSLRKGFAFARSADALGISLGSLLGVLAAFSGIIRTVYLIDITCMCLLIYLLIKAPKKTRNNKELSNETKNKNRNLSSNIFVDLKWITKLIPVLVLSLLATGILTLLQSALPLDLVNGGLNRPPIKESLSSGIISTQLILLVLLQWPIGKWLSHHNIKFSLKISFISFSAGCFLLGCSAFWRLGSLIVLAAQIPFSIGLAAFLPTSTEAVIRQVPKKNTGLAMAMYSQCFAISAFIAPLMAGQIMDNYDHAVILWILMSIFCFGALSLINTIKEA